MDVVLLVARLVLASVFALASSAKFADLAGSRAAVAGFGVPSRVADMVGRVLPVAELAVAIALLPHSSARLGAIGAFALLTLFTFAIARSMTRGEAPECHCFGQLHSEPAGPRALARNLLLGGAAAFVAIAGRHDAGSSAIGWIGRLSGSGLVAFITGIGFVALAAASAAGWLALLRQQGRLLLRIDELEARLGAAGLPSAPALHVGLPIGSTAPPFTLSGLDGDTATLDSLTASGQPVLLLFTDPGCGPCNALMPQISAWQRQHSARLTIAVMARGQAAYVRTTVREHGIASVWLDDRLEVYNLYEAGGTPAAVLVDAQGRIASAVVAGADAIAELVDVALRGAPRAPQMQVVRVPEDRRARSPAFGGRPIGAEAPRVELRALDGQPVVLAGGDTDTLVLFWNPGCGFCERMLDDVRALARSLDGPRLLLISAGTASENRALGVQAPIVLDPGFMVASAFGSTGTPSAVLVDREGRIASRLAVGAAAVLTLAGERVGSYRAAAEA